MITGTGVDITEVSRLRKAVEKWGDDFLNRVFTSDEINRSLGRANRFQHLAGRFAAKEAVFKAFGNKDLTWKDIEIMNDETGRPYCVILNQRKFCKDKQVDIQVSISHVKSYAVASATVTQKS